MKQGFFSLYLPSTSIDVAVKHLSLTLVKFKFLFFILFNLTTLSAGFYSAEILLNRYKPWEIIKGNPNLNNKNTTWGVPFFNNRFGFREREFTVSKQRGVYRIMVLGDSFTFGVGLKTEDRYTDVLEKSLNQRFPRKKWEVLNFGLNGASTVDEMKTLKAFHSQVQPDRIIVGFCRNDPKQEMEYLSPERIRFEKRYGEYIESVVRLFDQHQLSALGSISRTAFYKFSEIVGFFPHWTVALGRSYEPTSADWIKFCEALTEIKRVSDGMKLPPPVFAVLNAGLRKDKPTDYRLPAARLRLHLKWYHQAEEAAKKIGFETLNYEKEIADEMQNEILTVNRYDWHSSAKLNHLYARKIFGIIVSDRQK